MKKMDSKQCNIFFALSDKTRYDIIIHLLQNSKKNTCCTDLSEITKKEISTITRQLDVLIKSNLIIVTKIKKNKCIKLKNPKLINQIIDLSKKMK